MTTIVPFYPQQLQSAISHAERLAELLVVEEKRGGGCDLADAWLTGRSGEIERFVEASLTDWREGRRDDSRAVAALHDHLTALHDGLALHLKMSTFPCCATAATTEVLSRTVVSPEATTIQPIKSLHERLNRCRQV